MKPSRVTEFYWLYAERAKGRYPKSVRSGKWLVFVHVDKVDEMWETIAKATIEGKLGGASKVATMKPNPNAVDPNTKVICVYTYDWKDKEDVMRVREELRKLGITWKLVYKTDEDTLKGRYAHKGDNVTTYYA